MSRVLFAVGLLAIACGRVTDGPPKAADSLRPLLVLTDARNVTRLPEYDGGFSYELADTYPASRTISELTQRLSDAGWQPQSEEVVFNKGDKGTAVREWTFLEVKDKTLVEWSGDWMNAAGDALMLNLEFRIPTSNPEDLPSGPLRVNARYYSANTVRFIREALAHAKQ